ncbi:hypothetical protein [Leifsonia sp. SIMBA_070]|uniref:hypothetical protein n=1 Tax=Leifsonia sp. SIMBA_070 TaxID=3085810 RepID=UPI00397AC4B0
MPEARADFPRRSGCGSQQGEEGVEGGGHVDRRVLQPLQLEAVGDRLQDARQGVRIQCGRDPALLLLPLQRAGEGVAQREAALGEVGVGGVLGVAGLHGQPGEQLHQPGNLRVVADDADESFA